MTEQARTLRAVRGLEVALREAVDDSKLAYEFAANSYSFSAMNACMAACEEWFWEREDDPAA
jgi:hypothetical protein